jgi:tRNA uridine 5-carbamoylmethylation protein Kti12
VYASIGSKTFSNGLKFTLQDNAAPTITLKGDSISYIEAYQNGTQVPFVDELYEAWDDIDGDITHKVKVTGIEDINYYKKGRYMVIYTVEDSHGHIASNYRTVVVRDTRAPIASLNHPELSEITLEYGEPYAP